MAQGLAEDLLAALAALDTPTVCNAVEIVAPERRGVGYTTEALLCARPNLPPIVGYARTATIRAEHPSLLSKAEQRERRLAYYEHVAQGPHPTVAVVQDLDDPPGFGAFWGEVNTAVHKGLGCIGVVTNGSIRDLDACAEGFQLLAGHLGPSHAFVHIEKVDVAVTVANMTVQPGDLIHADKHGAVVIPLSVAGQVPDAAALVARRESVILGAARRPGFDFAALAKALRKADEIH